MNYCAIEGCENPQRSRGWCEKHYLRWHRRGTTGLARFSDPVARLFSRIAAGPNDCWIWTGPLNGEGYGLTWHEGRGVKAHQLSYVLHEGAVPAGLELDHLCRERRCANPRHLEPVTHAENVARRPRPTHCPQGHEYTTENTLPTGHGLACRTCSQVRRRERVTTAPDIDRPRQTHCKRGHELTPENTYIRGRYWRCRECCRESDRRRQPRKLRGAS